MTCLIPLCQHTSKSRGLCSNHYMSRWRDLNRTKYAAYCQEYAPIKRKHQKKYNLKHNYNLTVEEYANMLIEQDYACAVCKTFMDNSSKQKQANVDHDHVTGKVRGILCSSCNRGLGLLKDSTETLKAMIEYLRK